MGWSRKGREGKGKEKKTFSRPLKIDSGFRQGTPSTLSQAIPNLTLPSVMVKAIASVSSVLDPEAVLVLVFQMRYGRRGSKVKCQLE